MTFARLLLEIRRRAASLPNDLPRSTALEQAACEVLETAGTQPELAQNLRYRTLNDALVAYERNEIGDTDFAMHFRFFENQQRQQQQRKPKDARK